VKNLPATQIETDKLKSPHNTFSGHAHIPAGNSAGSKPRFTPVEADEIVLLVVGHDQVGLLHMRVRDEKFPVGEVAAALPRALAQQRCVHGHWHNNVAFADMVSRHSLGWRSKSHH
jgi:hypothetical protein